MSYNPFDEILQKLEAIERKLNTNELPSPADIAHSQPASEKLLSRREAAEFLGISLPTLHNWTMEGKLSGYRIGTRVRYKKEELSKSLRTIKVK